MSQNPPTAEDRRWRRRLHEAFSHWCSSSSSNPLGGPLPAFEAGFEAGRLEAELEHLDLERITVEAVVPEPGYYETQEEWVVHRGQTYRKKRKKS